MYITYCSEIEKKLSNNYTTVLEFVDDLCIGCTGSTLKIAQKRLQNKLNQLSCILAELQLQVAPKKSNVCIFTRHRIMLSPRIRINNQNVKVVKKVKFLGVWFDEKSTWQSEVEHIQNKVQKGINIMRMISGVTWGAHPLVLLNIYRCLVRSHFDYSGTIISTASNTRLHKIDVLQYRALRIIMSHLQSTPKQIINFETLETPLQIRRESVTFKYYINRSQYLDLPIHRYLEELEPFLRADYWRRKRRPILSVVFKTLKKVRNITSNNQMPYFQNQLDQVYFPVTCNQVQF